MKNICNAPFGTLMITNEGYGYCCRCVSETFLYKNNNDSIYEIYNSNEFVSVRNDFLNNNTPKECNICPAKMNYDGDICEHIVHFERPKIHRIQIMHDNNCNLSCKSCSSHNSKMFDKLIGDIHRKNCNNNILFEPYNYNTQDCDFGYDIIYRFKNIYMETRDDLNEILFAGGEFMLTDKNIEYLKIIDKNKKIMIFTNGTTYNEDILHEMNKFENCVLIFSIDGDNNTNHLIRPYAKYDTIKKHLNMVYNNFPNIKIHINTTVSSLNIKTLPNTITNIISDFINNNIVKYWDISALKHPQIYNLENNSNNDYVINKLIESLLYTSCISDSFIQNNCREKITYLLNILSNGFVNNYNEDMLRLLYEIDDKLNIDTSIYMDV